MVESTFVNILKTTKNDKIYSNATYDNIIDIINESSIT